MSFILKWLRPHRFVLILILSLSILLSVPRLVAQQEQESPEDKIHHDTGAKMEKERRQTEWKKLKGDTDKLFQAASELKS